MISCCVENQLRFWKVICFHYLFFSYFSIICTVNMNIFLLDLILYKILVTHNCSIYFLSILVIYDCNIYFLRILVTYDCNIYFFRMVLRKKLLFSNLFCLKYSGEGDRKAYRASLWAILSSFKITCKYLWKKTEY